MSPPWHRSMFNGFFFFLFCISSIKGKNPKPVSARVSETTPLINDSTDWLLACETLTAITHNFLAHLSTHLATHRYVYWPYISYAYQAYHFTVRCLNQMHEGSNPSGAYGYDAFVNIKSIQQTSTSYWSYSPGHHMSTGALRSWINETNRPRLLWS